MQYCDYCQVRIVETRDTCPLCGNKVTPIDDTEKKREVFPVIPSYLKSHLALRVLSFISIVIIVVSFAYQAIFPSDFNWPLLLLFALISIWFDLYFLVQKRHHIPKKIIWQVAIISLLSIFWDWNTGWRGWSLNYVIPISCVTAMLIMYVTAIILKLSVRDYITYAFIDSLFGIIPILFILFDWVDVIYPSVISIAISVIFLSAIFILQGKSIRNELNKRMYI